MRKFKIALIQMYSEFGKVLDNIQKADDYVRKAASNGAQLIALPEMFNTGLDFNKMKDGMKYAEKMNGVTLTHFSELASKLRVHILCPILVSNEDNTWENTAFLIDDEGVILGGYTKTHPVGDERQLVKRGTKYPVFDTKLGKIGISICYDACFPETSRILALNGVEMILIPAAWRGSHYFKRWWDLNIQCRAIDNLCYVAAINQCGYTGDGSEMYAGKSQIVNPIGEVQAMAGVETEDIVYGDIFIDRVKAEREFNTVLSDRHPEDYNLLKNKWEGV